MILVTMVTSRGLSHKLWLFAVWNIEETNNAVLSGALGNSAGSIVFFFVCFLIKHTVYMYLMKHEEEEKCSNIENHC